MTVPRFDPAVGQRARPLWSVMVPTCEPDLSLLRATIESVFASGLPAADRQIAIVDDATRSSEFDAFAEEMRALGVEIFRADERLGLAGNWNRCVARARGIWVHILHQDDRVRPGFYAALAQGIWTDTNIGAAFCQPAFVDAGGRAARIGHMPPGQAGIVHDWIERVVVNLVVQCPCIVVRRAVYERLGGFDDAYAYCADYDMWQRIASEYPIWYEPQPLAEYREHDASASRRLFNLSRRWHERCACLKAGVQRLSPAIRATVERNGRYYFTRVAWSEFTTSFRSAPWVARLESLLALARMSRFAELLAMARGRYPQPVPGRAPVRGSDYAAPRTPRILLVSEFFPADPERLVFGGFQRLRRHVDAIARVGHLDAAFLWPENWQLPDADIEEYRQRVLPTWSIAGQIDLISAESGQQADSRRHPLQAAIWMWRGAVSFFHTQPTLRTSGRRMAHRLRGALLAFQPDIIFAHRLGAMAALIRVDRPLPPVVIDFDDLEHVRIARMTAGEKNPLKKLQARVWIWIARRCMRIAANRARVSLICSEHDRTHLSAMAPTANIEVVPNTARSAEPMPAAESPTAMFVGIAHYGPNSDAILRLVHDLWPRVRRLVPDARLIIVGETATTLAVSNPEAGLTVLDFVPDLAGIYREARIALCPITRGSGTRIKIIEAAMYARPVVSTRIGAEGLAFVPGSEILIADEPDEFAQRCADLLLDPERCEKIGRAAGARAHSEYDPERIATDLAGVISGALENHLQASPCRIEFYPVSEFSCRPVPSHLSS